MPSFFYHGAHLGAPVLGEISVWLLDDNWDDWFKYATTFRAFAFNRNGDKLELGEVKIGHVGLTSQQRRPEISAHFEVLPDGFFSLGQSESYYETLNLLGLDQAQEILRGLRDCAFDLKLFERYLSEPVMQTSLLRSVAEETVRGRFHRLAVGNATLTPYQFSYFLPPSAASGSNAVELKFEVEPESRPPTNVHVLIGRNGVGKTRILNEIQSYLAGAPAAGSLELQGVEAGNGEFLGLVAVSFSAFDDFSPIGLSPKESSRLKFAYIGLKRDRQNNQPDIVSPKSLNELTTEWVTSVGRVMGGARRTQYITALRTLESDPLFSELEIESRLASLEETELASFFLRLSSGHKIVLLTITRLVEIVEERTLVLLDEPEAHLHPPLLAAFTRALSDLLASRNGVSIVATHSPVLLQEVPRSCAWVLQRSGAFSRADRPSIETFGENTGILTRVVFGLEVTQSGYHALLRSVVDENQAASFDGLLALISGQLGAEGRSVLQALIASDPRA
jgi:ABC-type cobalamin/Fe3+-siderophores transport system ATPase subunit